MRQARRSTPRARAREAKMSKARMELDWDAMREAAIDPELMDKRREPHKNEEACAMCGNFCAVRMMREGNPAAQVPSHCQHHRK